LLCACTDATDARPTVRAHSHHLDGGEGTEGDLLGELRSGGAARLDHRLEGLAGLKGEQSGGGGQFPEALGEAAAGVSRCGGRVVVLKSGAVQDIQAVVGAVHLGGGRGIERQIGATDSSCR